MNKRGSANLLLLVLLPLILSIAAVALAGALSIHFTEKTNFICRQGVLNAENQMLSSLKKLMSLNPMAKTLRQMNHASKLTLIIPIYGQLGAMSIQEARVLFHSLQLKIIHTANFQMMSSLNLTKSQIKSSFQFFSSPTTTEWIHSEILNSPSLAVEARPRDSLTPDYVPKKNFTELMLSQIKWKVQISKLLPQWLTNFLRDPQIFPQDYLLNLSCAGSLDPAVTKTKFEDFQETGTQWLAGLSEKNRVQTEIIRVKQLSNSF